MTLYEQLLNTADKQNIIVKEKSLSDNDGLIYKNCIAIRNSLPATKEKTCVLAEYLDITEEYLSETLKHYQSKHGVYTIFDQYVIYFEPYFLMEKIFC